MLSSRPGFLTIVLIYGFLQFALTAQALATENPDELYRSGRFKEAEKAYAGMDMDNPRDIRYRYNRGCAAFQNSQYKEASAAFSSVITRAEDNDVRFKAAYNLGNAAFKQGDYQSAALHYKQALIYNPSSEDARYNLELALRTLEKLKKDKMEGPKQESHGEEAEKGKDEKKGTDKDKKGDGKASQERRADKKSSKRQEKTGDRSEARSGPEKESGHTTAEGLSGELKPLQELPEMKNKHEMPGSAISGIDKKKAEALLDNMKENQSRILRFAIPEEKQHGVPSGKDW